MANMFGDEFDLAYEGDFGGDEEDAVVFDEIKKTRSHANGGSNSNDLKEVKDFWQEYPSIDNGKSSVASKVAPDDAARDDWIALEKVHGSNFCFVVGEKKGDKQVIEIVGARRNAVMQDCETFFGWQGVRDKLQHKLRALFASAKQFAKENDLSEVRAISVFGELFGGIYPHKDVEDLGHQFLQKGVYYSAEVDFYAFDMELHFYGDEPSQWMNYSDAMKLLRRCAILYAIPLIQGSLARMFVFEIAKRDSVLPEQLGLPKLDKNQIEGIVIKCATTVFKKGYRGDSTRHLRAIWKRKNPKFEEVNPKVGPTKWETIRDERLRSIERCHEELARRVENDNRLNAVISKLGVLTLENRSTIAEALAEDALKDYVKDVENPWGTIQSESDDQKKIISALKSRANSFVMEQLNNNK
eukprot:TRINITY_DN5751_c0_g1_i2.p1 TRINITY_DN5751_c0_g1~~TRINITY_DN5751_c0_g1_i2.p1  ORF type:complete len:413 (+),score=116.85 TRINITY_DN5751_c0_g1_i2:188-1426(+)